MAEETKKKKAATAKISATGRRKESVARVFLSPGKGDIMVNKRQLTDYFTREELRLMIMQPFTVTNTQGKYDVYCTITGGGISGQAGALRHGISRALVAADESTKLTLRRAGLLTRDPRMKERKKYGQKGARKRFQFSKR